MKELSLIRNLAILQLFKISFLMDLRIFMTEREKKITMITLGVNSSYEMRITEVKLSCNII